MRKKRDWFWHIKAIGQGPDYVFLATFDPSDAEQLAAMVQQHLPSDHVYDKDSINHQVQGSRYVCYVDTHTHNRLVTMRESGTKESIWYYGQITVCNHTLRIEHVLSGGSYGGTDLILALAQAPDLTLQEWKVAYSGYAWGEVASGTTAEELLDYLHSKE